MAYEYGVDNGDGTITVWVNPEDGSDHYPVRTETTAQNQGLTAPTGGAPSGGVDPALTAYLTSVAQDRAYTRAQSAADDAYRQAVLGGQSQDRALREAQGAANLELQRAQLELERELGTGRLGLERERFGLEKNLALAEMQANPRDIFKLAAYTAGVGGQGFGAPAGSQPATGGTGGVETRSLDQARQELVRAGGDDSWMSRSPQEVASEYTRLSGRYVQGVNAPTGGTTSTGTTTTSGGNPAELDFYKNLQAQFGSAPNASFPFAPQTPIPQPNAIPLNWYSQQSPFNRGLLEAAYSTAGLSEDVYKRPQQLAQSAFGG